MWQNFTLKYTGGYSVQRTLQGRATNMGSKIKPLGIWMTRNKMKNLVYEWVDFQNYPKIGSNLRKFLKNWAILLKIWPKIGLNGIWMSQFFLKNWSLYGCTFKYRGGTSLPKPNLSTPPGSISSCEIHFDGFAGDGILYSKWWWCYF